VPAGAGRECGARLNARSGRSRFGHDHHRRRELDGGPVAGPLDRHVEIRVRLARVQLAGAAIRPQRGTGVARALEHAPVVGLDPSVVRILRGESRSHTPLAFQIRRALEREREHFSRAPVRRIGSEDAVEHILSRRERARTDQARGPLEGVVRRGRCLSPGTSAGRDQREQEQRGCARCADRMPPRSSHVGLPYSKRTNRVDARPSGESRVTK
jgi:hypothetical protein